MESCGHHDTCSVIRVQFGNDVVPVQYNYNLEIQEQQQQTKKIFANPQNVLSKYNVHYIIQNCNNYCALEMETIDQKNMNQITIATVYITKTPIKGVTKMAK